MAKGMFEKAAERFVLNAVGVWGRKMANVAAEKATDKIEKRKVAQKTRKATGNEDADETFDSDEPEAIE